MKFRGHQIINFLPMVGFYEEISPQRAINGAAFTQGLCDWRFSVRTSSGGAWVPSMSYFLIEYTFSNVAGNDAPVSASKHWAVIGRPIFLLPQTLKWLNMKFVM